MKIKVLAAMMALASTGAMANNVNQLGFEASAEIAETCVLTSANSEQAKLGFVTAPSETGATFRLKSNKRGNITYTISSIATNVTFLTNGETATDDINIVAGDGTTDVTTGAQPFTVDGTGEGSFEIKAFMSQADTAYQANTDANISATVTVSCGEVVSG